MEVRKKSSILKKAVLPWALAVLLGMGVFAGTAFAGTKGEGQELTREDIYAEYHQNGPQRADNRCCIYRRNIG